MKLPFGPGALVAAAFIGPGTVTACTLAGANFGYALIWALVFATFATMVLQDMAARLGIAGGMGLGEALVAPGTPVALKWLSMVLVLAALALGNSAYEAGNLSGGALGAGAAFGLPAERQRWLVWALAALAGSFLLNGRYKVLEGLLITLVLLMSLAFAGSLFEVRRRGHEILSDKRQSYCQHEDKEHGIGKAHRSPHLIQRWCFVKLQRSLYTTTLNAPFALVLHSVGLDGPLCPPGVQLGRPPGYRAAARPRGPPHSNVSPTTFPEKSRRCVPGTASIAGS